MESEALRTIVTNLTAKIGKRLNRNFFKLDNSPKNLHEVTKNEWRN